jgi:hypothetical protein
MGEIPENKDALLTRNRLAVALTEQGYPVSPATLSTKASRGGGPPYHLFAGRAIYRWGDALHWAMTLVSLPRRNTSEGDLLDKGFRK